MVEMTDFGLCSKRTPAGVGSDSLPYHRVYQSIQIQAEGNVGKQKVVQKQKFLHH